MTILSFLAIHWNSSWFINIVSWSMLHGTYTNPNVFKIAFSTSTYFLSGVDRYKNLTNLAQECVCCKRTINGHLLSSTFESNWVTFCDKFWILSWREFVLWKILFVSAHNSPKRSSACLEMLLSWRIIPHNVFTDTASNSLFSPSANLPRLSSMGSTDRFISGMVDHRINQHRRWKPKIPTFCYSTSGWCWDPYEITKFRSTTERLPPSLKHPTWRLPPTHNSLQVGRRKNVGIRRQSDICCLHR